MWTHIGQQRPAFADPTAPGQESVWDYSRPPRLQDDARRVVVRVGETVIADTTRAKRVLETAGPPTFYLPPDDIDQQRLRPATGESLCEWKGRAAYWSVSADDGSWLDAVAWGYPEPSPPFAEIAGWLSFYPARLICEVAGERVRPQPGEFYGGWMTNDIVGPVKGAPGTAGW